MNACKEISSNFMNGKVLSTSESNKCIISNNVNYTTTGDYVFNISDITFDRFIGDITTNRTITICKYDRNLNYVSATDYFWKDFPEGPNHIQLDDNYFYKISYAINNFHDFKMYQCNVGIGSMANELAFGKLTFLDEIGTIIPFVIPLIAFALGFLLLKNLIKRGNQGHA